MITTYILDEAGFDLSYDQEDTLPGIKPIQNSEFKVNNDIFITASKDDMIDINRTIALALSSGHAEYKISDGRNIIVKISR